MVAVKLLQPATSRGEATRARLLEAAENEFGERGFHGASVASITGRAGLGQGTFYLYFPSKEAIFVHLVDAIGEALCEELEAALDGIYERHRLRTEASRVLLAFAWQQTGRSHLVQEARFVVPEAFRRFYQALVELLVRHLGELPPGERLSGGPAQICACSWLGAAAGVGLYCQWQRLTPPLEWLTTAP